MFSSYLKIAIRNLMHKKMYTAINIVGLAIGISCSFLIFLFIQSELSYDKHYANSENIYRMGVEYNIGGKVDRYCNMPRPIGHHLKANYPEVLEVTRVSGVNGLRTHKAVLTNDQKRITTNKIFAVDSTFFNVFATEFIYGNPEDALSDPHSIILTESFAKKMFGPVAPYQQTLRLDNTRDFTVRAVIKDIPGKTHLPYEALVPWEVEYRAGEEDVWYGWHVYTYALFPDGYNVIEFHDKFQGFFTEYMKETFDRSNGTAKLIMQPIQSIHLTSNLTWEPYTNGNINNIYIFSIVAIFLLIIACVNYMNLATARSEHRGREVGLRKTFGSNRSALVWQFIIESICISLCAALVALGLAEVLLPLFNSLLVSPVSIDLLHNLHYLLMLVGLALVIGFISGLYPALYLSSFLPVKVLKGNFSKGNGGAILRKILMVFQFVISITLITGTIIVLQQMKFAKGKELGFAKENVMVITVQDSLVNRKLPYVSEQLLSNPNILGAATSYSLPGVELNHLTVSVENDEGEFDPVGCQFMRIDHDFADMMQFTFLQGRNFSRDTEKEMYAAALVNEAAVAKFGWHEKALERGLAFGRNQDGSINRINVVGVVKNFHVGSLHNAIQPIVLFLAPDGQQLLPGKQKYLFLRLKGDSIVKTVTQIRQTWKTVDPANPLEYTFLESTFDNLYKTEEKLIKLFSYFSVITVFIACFGLLGLASYTAEQRTKEMGIRKVLGASTSHVAFVLSLEFIKWIAIANCLAWPIAYLVMRRWLQDFAYHITISWPAFAIAGTITVAVALVTISYQTIKTAVSNPIIALKNEGQ